MSDPIKHECGLAFIRLRKPFEYYYHKYKTPFYGLQKLQLLMQKQRNRGQDGAGIVSVKIDPTPGNTYIDRERTNQSNYIQILFDGIYQKFTELGHKKQQDIEFLKNNLPFMGEVLMGHLRYGTHGSNSIKNVHPVLRKNNWMPRNLALAGNFNLTNVSELFDELISYGQHPHMMSDTITILEKIGHFLDLEVEKQFRNFKSENYNTQTLSAKISEHLDIGEILSKASKSFDGGYVIGGIIGNGDAFILKDPSGIRPAFYYYDDDIVVAASERPAIQTTFDVKVEDIKPLGRGNALIVKSNGNVQEVSVNPAAENNACSFERIYFSRGTDRDIYLERKELGRKLTNKVLNAINHDFENTVFCHIPNTAEVAFRGLVEGMNCALNQIKTDQILTLGQQPDKQALISVLNSKLRIENLVVKDAKMRTFISDTNTRGELVSHVYDVTYGIVRDHFDTLVLIDDSIVRGTTLKDSIISIISRLAPKKILILSSAPQIRYPDCYGIDMSRMNEFVAFNALLNLLARDGKENLLTVCYEKCKAQENIPFDVPVENYVKALYASYTDEDISAEIARIVTPESVSIPVEVIFQTVEDLKSCMPDHPGVWYFSGDFPTKGGTRVVNRAFVNFMENKNERAY
ncbi:MAG TPA: amidophosphoribosyltransferase [Saprospiraceae bacterium]|nr:amidophosphoribosyltransferase [Saprospirales bacterium]HRQ28526.1 amidophosphoribosyltransferase [Saprospiraceae bacterium]